MKAIFNNRRRGGFGAIAFIAVALFLGQSSPGAVAQNDAGACDRTCLKGHMDAYLAALVSHDPAGLPLAPALVVRENARPADLGRSEAWTMISAVHPGYLFASPADGAVVYAGAVDGPNGLASALIRLEISGGRIAASETIFNHGSPSGVFAPQNLLEPDLIYDAVVPAQRRVERARMIALVDGYMESFGARAPRTEFSLRCDRYASGSKTTNNGAFRGGAVSCADSFTNLTGQDTVDRRFPLVDEERGIVLGYFLVPHGERDPPSTLYVGEVFKIVDGKIRSIEEFSAGAAYPPQPVFAP
jgi:hypothetical protein